MSLFRRSEGVCAYSDYLDRLDRLKQHEQDEGVYDEEQDD